MDKLKVQATHREFVEVIRPLLQADGRNNVIKVAQFINRNVRSDISIEEQIDRVKGACRRSRVIALQIWISDLHKLFKDQVDVKIRQVIEHYLVRNNFSDAERTYFEQLRREEVQETYTIML